MLTPANSSGTLVQMNTKLTRRQQKVYKAILKFRKAHGFSPTYRELMKLCGISSPNGIACHLRALTSKGYISMGTEEARSIVPLVGEKCSECGRLL